MSEHFPRPTTDLSVLTSQSTLPFADEWPLPNVPRPDDEAHQADPERSHAEKNNGPAGSGEHELSSRQGRTGRVVGTARRDRGRLMSGSFLLSEETARI